VQEEAYTNNEKAQGPKLKKAAVTAIKSLGSLKMTWKNIITREHFLICKIRMCQQKTNIIEVIRSENFEIYQVS
jgi:hypothetical protein